MKKKGYRIPVQNLAGLRTFVSPSAHLGLPSPTSTGWSTGATENHTNPDDAGYRQRALPASDIDSEDRVKSLPQAYFNVPIFTDPKPSGLKFENRIQPHIPSRPGEFTGDVSGPPTKYDYNYLTRRTMMAFRVASQHLTNQDPLGISAMAARVASRHLEAFYRREEAADAVMSKESPEDRALGTPGRNPERQSIRGPSYRRQQTLQWSVDSNRESLPTSAPDFGSVSQSGGNAGRSQPMPRIAAYISSILEGVAPDIIERASILRPQKKRVNKKQGIWVYKVGKYEVKIRLNWATKRHTSFGVADSKVKCSCPFWRWQGPEHWGTAEGYLYPPARGTASTPVIMDPSGKKRVCKHAYAVLSRLQKQHRVRRK